MKNHQIPKHLRTIRGGFKGHFVIKHYRGGLIVKTKFPDMSGIVASMQQRKCRDLFAEAVVYAKSVIADPKLKAAWQKRIRRRNGVYHKAIKAFLLREKNVLQSRLLLEMQQLRLAFRNAAMIKKDEVRADIGIPVQSGIGRQYVFLETG